MNASVTKLFKEAAELTEADRAALAGLLIESLESAPEAGIDAAWAAEIERRIKQLDSGEVKAIPWEEVRAKLWARFRD
jgi:putative addiction module component (TIGR02574 family)